jgi:hypothetical protein
VADPERGERRERREREGERERERKELTLPKIERTAELGATCVLPASKTMRVGRPIVEWRRERRREVRER